MKKRRLVSSCLCCLLVVAAGTPTTVPSMTVRAEEEEERAGNPLCNICPDGLAVTDPDATVPAGGGVIQGDDAPSCGQIQLDGVLGKYSEDECAALQASVGSICGCAAAVDGDDDEEEETAPAGAPPAEARNPLCNICPGDLTVTDPDAIVPAGTAGGGIIEEDTSCGQVLIAGVLGAYDEEECAALQASLETICGCAVWPPEPTVSPAPTAAPPPTTVAPTAAPTATATTAGPSQTPTATATTAGPSQTPTATATTAGPSSEPSEAPVEVPTLAPTAEETTAEPTTAEVPTQEPSRRPEPATPGPSPPVADGEPTVAPAAVVPTAGPGAPTVSPTAATVAPIPAPAPTASDVVPVSGEVRIVLRSVAGEMPADTVAKYEETCVEFFNDDFADADPPIVFAKGELTGQQLLDSGRTLRALQGVAAVFPLDTVVLLNGNSTAEVGSLNQMLADSLNANATGFIDLLLLNSDGYNFRTVSEVEASDPAVFPPAPAPTPDDDDDRLTGGAVAGIVIGSVAGGALLIGAGTWAQKRGAAARQRAVHDAAADSMEPEPKKSAAGVASAAVASGSKASAVPEKSAASAAAEDDKITIGASTVTEKPQGTTTAAALSNAAAEPSATGNDSAKAEVPEGSEGSLTDDVVLEGASVMQPSLAGDQSYAYSLDAHSKIDDSTTAAGTTVAAGGGAAGAAAAGPVSTVGDSDETTPEVSSGAVSSTMRHNMVSRIVLAPPGRLGVVIDTTLDGPVVHSVSRESPLEGTLFPGDIIVAIDDVDTRAMTASAITALMIRTANQRRKLTVLSEDITN
jgi:hypothetical protein